MLTVWTLLAAVLATTSSSIAGQKASLDGLGRYNRKLWMVTG